MRSRLGRRVGWMGSIVAGLLLAASAPAHATSTLTTPDGAVHTVWEVRTRFRLDGDRPGQWHLAYSVALPEGETLTGIIAPTGDTAQDSAPRLALDPATRKAIVAWTRDDGTSLQIAYARFEAGGWGDFHYLTFGRSDKRLPRIGISLYGSFLFYVEDGQNYMYAPVDLSRGSLYAAPRAISQGALQRTDDGSSTTSSVYLGASSSTAGTRLREPGDGTTQGGQDVPINIKCNKPDGCPSNANVWDVGSRSNCRPQVLVIPGGDLYQAYVVRFDDGAVSLLQVVPVPYPVPEDFGGTTAATFLDAICSSSY